MATTCFEVTAHPDPQALLRVLNFFAQQALCPQDVRATQADGRVSIRIHQPDLGERQAAIIAEKMRAQVLVESVGVSRAPCLPAT